MYKKVKTYIYNTTYGIRCYKKEDIENIITEVIKEHPNETSHVKLGMIAKRRIQGIKR